MILKKIFIKNIRSYGSDGVEIEFPMGYTLFQGDVGCGKSTILNCIEFALFGCSELDRSELLRRNEDKGVVKLSFKIGDKDYWIKREIVRNGSRVELDKTILWNGERELDLKIIDSRKEVFNILNIKDNPHSPTPPSFFRYSIYTPQEQVKHILTAEPDERLKILRQAFRIEDYERAILNIDGVKTKLRGETKKLEGATENIELKEKQTDELEKQITNIKSKIKESQEQLSQFRNNREEAVKGLEELQKQLREFEDLEKQRKDHQNFLSEIQGDVEQYSLNLENYSKRLQKLESEFEIKSKELNKIKENNEVQRLEDELNSLKHEKSKLKKQISQLQGLKDEFLSKEKELLLKQSQHQRLIKDMEDLKNSKTELEGKVKELKHKIYRLELPEKSETQIIEEIQHLNNKKNESTEKLAILKQEIKNKKKLVDEKICPTCGQPTDSRDFLDQVDMLEKEKALLKGKIQELTSSIEKLELQKSQQAKHKELALQINDLEQRLNEAVSQEREIYEEIEILKQDIKSLKEFIKDNEDKVKELDLKKEEVDDLKTKENNLVMELKELKSAKVALQNSLVDYEKRIEETKNDIENIQQQIENKNLKQKEIQSKINTIEAKLKGKAQLNSRYTALNNEVFQWDNQISQITSSINKMQGILDEKIKSFERVKEEVEELKRKKQKMDKILQFLSWVDNRYIPALKDIEKKVMERIHARFNQLFQKWFGLLMENEEYIAKIAEDFSPVIEQDGYDIPVSTLSGGEKTCVAMSYRFALNQIVMMINTSMLNGLMILDEPTDGFSRDQIFRLRDVFEDLNCSQVIMVSHESEMEDLVDNIILVTKQNGESKLHVRK